MMFRLLPVLYSSAHVFYEDVGACYTKLGLWAGCGFLLLRVIFKGQLLN